MYRSTFLCALLVACPTPPDEEPATDVDGDGYGPVSEGGTDCDDADAAVHPGAPETCDGVDEDCDGTADEDATDAGTFWADTDDDGYGDEDAPSQACAQPDGTADNADDCDDADDAVFPGAQELCNGTDDDCDGRVDVDADDAGDWYRDSDRDGYGDPSSIREGCTAPAGYVADDTDCDDSDAAINPELVWFADGDADGYGNDASTTASCTRPAGHVAAGGDCDDASNRANPGATEVCDLADNDCDGTVDDGGTGCEAWVGAFTGSYRIQAEEKAGSTVVNDMVCLGTFAATVDYSAVPPLQGTVTCTQSRYPGFDSPQTGTISGEVGLDGSFTGTLRHKYNSYATRNHDATGTLDGGLSFEGTGRMRPASASAVDWLVNFQGSAD